MKTILGIVCAVASMPAVAMDVTLAPATSAPYQYIYVTDTIDTGDDAKLSDALDQLASAGKQPVVVLDSRGGDVDVSMVMGNAIRSHNAVTYHRYCASSCVFAFLGGVQRFDDKTDDSVLIIHRPELAEAYISNPTPGAKSMLGMLENYIVKMTGSNELYTNMMQVPFHDLHELTQDEALHTHTITGVVK